MEFSSKLVGEAKEYFFRRTGKELADETINLYLERLANFGLIVFDSLSKSIESSELQDFEDLKNQPHDSCDENHGLKTVVTSKVVGQDSKGTYPVAQCPQSAVDDRENKKK